MLFIFTISIIIVSLLILYLQASEKSLKNDVFKILLYVCFGYVALSLLLLLVFVLMMII